MTLSATYLIPFGTICFSSLMTKPQSLFSKLSLLSDPNTACNTPKQHFGVRFQMTPVTITLNHLARHLKDMILENPHGSSLEFDPQFTHERTAVVIHVLKKTNIFLLSVHK